MSRVRLLLFLAFWLVPLACFAGKDNEKFDDWRPVEPWETQIKDVPGNPGAPAIQLYYGLTRDDPAQFEFVYKRIKILNEKGKDREYSDVQIELWPDIQLADLKARTIHPDGKIIDFGGHVFDKTIVKARGFKISGKSFSFADVTVGSILEYKYRLTWKSDTLPYTLWFLQHNLFTSKEEFRFRAYRVIGRIAYAYLNQLSATDPQLKGEYWRLDLENVPGLAEEEYAPPENEYQPLVIFYYGGNEIASPDAFWREVTKVGTNLTEKFIGHFSEVQADAAATIGSETDPEKKLRKLYARVQQIRNLSFERTRSAEEIKKEGLKLPDNAAEVLRRQYGTHLEINRLFIALARAAGFDAAVMRVANRDVFTFSKDILSLRQLDLEIAAVEMSGKTLFLDPGTRFCPFGLLRWTRTAVPALRLGKDGGGFIEIPASPVETTSSRVIDVSVDATGNLQGDLTVEFRGEEALERRIQAIDADDAGRKKSLEEEVSDTLPNGALVKLKDVQGWSDQDAPLVARFSLQVPSFAAVTGKRLIAPAFPFQSRRKVFANGDRRTPIVFPYSFSLADTVKMKFPEGYAMEHPPHERKTALYDARYQILNSHTGNQLVVNRSLTMNSVRFGTERLMEMKEFFAVVQAGDEGQAVFQQQETAAAQP
ncbi:MAG TPA: DUF3857 and transglutaminase domain-containing protein [Candidatus Angelobacter sp.]|jgi:hypothetical protein